jgi:hypothetical protein
MSSPKDSPKMTKQNASFGEVLRAVGQGLESLVENFEFQGEETATWFSARRVRHHRERLRTGRRNAV